MFNQSPSIMDGSLSMVMETTEVYPSFCQLPFDGLMDVLSCEWVCVCVLQELLNPVGLHWISSLFHHQMKRNTWRPFRMQKKELHMHLWTSLIGLWADSHSQLCAFRIRFLNDCFMSLWGFTLAPFMSAMYSEHIRHILEFSFQHIFRPVILVQLDETWISSQDWFCETAGYDEELFMRSICINLCCWVGCGFFTAREWEAVLGHLCFKTLWI